MKNSKTSADLRIAGIIYCERFSILAFYDTEITR